VPRQQNDRSAVPRVIVSVSGGVADVLYKPKGVEVCIFDYDVDGADADQVDRDPDNALCSIGQWNAAKAVINCKHWPIVRNAARQIGESRKQRWQCPKCRRIVQPSDASLAEAGTPYCADCDRHMDML